MMSATPSALAAGLRRFTVFGSFVAIVLGVLSLAGRVLGLSRLDHALVGIGTTDAGTAICLTLLGAALWLRRDADAKGRTRLMAQALSLFVAIVGAVSLMESLLDWDLGPDVLLVSEAQPKRMAFVTALDVGLLGASICVLDVRWSKRLAPAEILALSAIVAALYAALDFLLRAEQTHVLLQTACALVVLAFAVVCARTDCYVGALLASPGLGGMVLRRVVPSAVAVTVLLEWIRWRIQSGAFEAAERIGVTWTTTLLIASFSALAIFAASAVERTEDARRLADKKLQRYTRSLLEGGLDPLLILSPAGRIIDMNRATQELAGVAREHMLGSVFTDYLSDPSAGRAAFEQVLKDGAVRDIAFVIRHASGTFRDLSCNAEVMENEAGEIEAVIATGRDVTAQKRSHELAATERKRFNEVLDGLPAHIALITKDQRVVFANRAFRECYGDPAHPHWAETRLRRVEQLARVLDTTQPLQWEAKGPDDREYQIHEVPFTDSDGTQLILEMGLDISARKQAERERAIEEAARQRAQAELLALNAQLEERAAQRAAELHEANNWVGVAERAAKAGFWSWDLLTKKVQCTPGLLELYGLPPDAEVSFETWARVVRPGDYESPEVAIERAVRERIPLENQYRVDLPNGQTRWIRSVGRVLCDAADRPQRVTGICLDISEYKLTQDTIAALNQALQRRVTELQTILDTVPIGIGITERIDPIQVRTNPALAHMMGLHEADVIGDPARLALRFQRHGQELAKRELPVDRAVRGETIVAELYEVIRPDAQIVAVEVSVAPLLDAQGKPRGAVAAFVDVTAQKQTERELRQRTEQLMAANAEAETFNYAMAHDLRTPLRHIHGFAELLAEEAGPGLTADSKRHLEKIREGARRMARLLDDLLGVAHIRRAELRLTDASLDAIVQDVVSSLREETQGRDIEWRVSALPQVQCDRVLIRQVFMNLLANALKFTRPLPHAIIEIGQSCVSGETVIFVRDNGVGFDMRYADKLFGLFQRLHSQEDFEGTGVGLAMVQRIMRMHGGRVWAQGEPDAGATVYLSFQPTQSKQADDTAAASAPRGSRPEVEAR